MRFNQLRQDLPCKYVQNESSGRPISQASAQESLKRAPPQFLLPSDEGVTRENPDFAGGGYFLRGGL